MGIPTQAWITNYIPLFHAIQLLMHVSAGLINLLSNMDPRTNMALHLRVYSAHPIFKLLAET